VEILLGLIIAVVWHIKSNKDKHYEDEDWEKIKNDWKNIKKTHPFPPLNFYLFIILTNHPLPFPNLHHRNVYTYYFLYAILRQ